jgi:hypothetical protein
MIEISNDEMLIVKSILIGKSKDEIKLLLNIDNVQIKHTGLESIDFLIREDNWDSVSDEVALFYFEFSKKAELSDLEKRVQKKNAKLGFLVNRERIKPVEVINKNPENKIIKKEVSKPGLNNKNSGQRDLSILAPIGVFRHYELQRICKILKIELSVIKTLCFRAKISFGENKQFTFSEWELISPELERIRLKLLEKRDKKISNKFNKTSKNFDYGNNSNEIVKEKFENNLRKDAIQRNALSYNSFKEISTRMRD